MKIIEVKVVWELLRVALHDTSDPYASYEWALFCPRCGRGEQYLYYFLDDDFWIFTDWGDFPSGLSFWDLDNCGISTEDWNENYEWDEHPVPPIYCYGCYLDAGGDEDDSLGMLKQEALRPNPRYRFGWS